MLSNPFDDLIPQNTNAQTANNSPFADLIPVSQSSQNPSIDNSTWGRIKRASMFPVAAGKSLTQGVQEVGQGLKQTALDYFGSDEKAKAYTKQVEAERQAFANDPIIQDFPATANYYTTLGNTAPYLVPMGGVAKAAEAIPYAGKVISYLNSGSKIANVTKGTLTGAATGNTQFVPDGGSRTLNTMAGGAFGGALPAAVETTSGVYNKLTNNVAENVFRGIDPKVAQANLDAARRLNPDFTITPAEASGSKLAAQAQGKYGISEQGALAMQKYGEGNLVKEKNIIGGFLNDLSPSNESAGNTIRSTAQNILNNETQKLQDAAKPFYKQAYNQTVPQDQYNQLLKDPIINKAYNDINNNFLYAKELNDVAPNSINRLDLVKRRIDDWINAAQRTGENNSARLLQGSKNYLTTTLKNSSDAYANALSTFGEGSKPLQALQNSNIGKIAKLPDSQVKNISKIIFDPTQTDIKVLNQLRDQISAQNPQAWNQIVRNEMERRMSLSSSDATGSTFYNKILSKDKDFNQFIAATKNIPGATQKLTDMRAAFKNLINPNTTRGAAKLASTSMDMPRSTHEYVINTLKNMFGGRYDKAAVNLMTSPTWDKELANLKNLSGPSKSIGLANLLAKIATVQTTRNFNDQLAGSQD